MTTLILTIMGEDRPGLVEALSGAIAEHGGNWEQSRMAHLANKFAGILLVNVADDQVAPLRELLQGMATQGLHVTVEHGTDSAAAGHRRLSLELLGQDHPGIMHDIAHALSRHGISIEELDTETRSASMAGGTLFAARATLLAPQSLPLTELREVLEDLANELMVDIELVENSE
ncbi:MAG: glycine cleavage system regulatory protein [Gammaproteobacteria bacterium]|jgi:glycine cleavage system regulatory protein